MKYSYAYATISSKIRLLKMIRERNMYTEKSLLDAGIMTQEEFDDKKKQIVGL